MLITTMISEIRRALGYPTEQELGDDALIMEIWGVTTFYRGQLRETHESWSIGRWSMVVNAGTPAETNIVPGDFAEAFLIKTYDPSNAYHMPRQVDIVKPEDMAGYWSGPDNLAIGGGFAHPHVAACFAPINEGGQWKLLWAPVHQQTCQYMVWYTNSSSTVPPIYDDVSQLPIEEQNFLLIADVSLNLFAHLAHPEKGLNERQKLLAATQEKKMGQWAPLFQEMRWNGFRREPRQHRKVFGENRSGRIGRGY